MAFWPLFLTFLVMKDRIKHLMESQHMTQQTFAEFLGISSAALSSMFNGRTNPTLNTVDAIRRKFTKINLDWLLYGNGPMFSDDKPSDAALSSSTPSGEQSLDFGQTDSRARTLLYDEGRGARVEGRESRVDSRVSNVEGGQTVVKYIDKPQRKITEIRIFFDDQTWETFVPKAGK